MRKLTRRKRRLTVAAAGLATACALAIPAAAQAATSYTPNSYQWYFSKWNIQQEVWPVTQGSGVTVAVVDGGVQASLPDLQGVMTPGGDMLSGSGNGEQDYAPNGGHGTQVAELIVGQGIAGGPVGIAPQAKILPVRASGAGTSMAPVANGIKYAADHGAQVINISLGSNAPSGTTCDPDLQDAVDYALARNDVVVAASGDTNLGGPGPEEPGTCAGVIAVGGVEANGSLWQYSTPGPYVAVAAPGDHIYAVSSDNQRASNVGMGTSYSAPLVSAAAALIRSQYPSMPWYTVVQRLINTAIPSGPVPNDGTGYGIIDIHRALDVTGHPVAANAPNPVYARYQAYLKSTGQSTSAPSATGPTSGTSDQVTGLIIVVVIGIVIAVVIAIVIIAATRKQPR